MAILNFPDNPQTGDQYTGDNGTTYVFDGVKWLGTAGSGTSGTNSIVNNGNTVQVDSTGKLILPSYAFPNTTGTAGQVLVWPNSGTTLAWGAGGANTGDLRFVSNAMYDLNGVIVENADLAHGATSAVIVPSNGTSDPLQLNNYYGPVSVTSGPNASDLKTWTFGTDGTLTLPSSIYPITFTATLDTAHCTTPITLTGDAWTFNIHFTTSPNGTVDINTDQPPPTFLTNPGYNNARTFRFTEADHGIPGYTFDIFLANIGANPPIGFTPLINFDQAPIYPSTLTSDSPVKLSSHNHHWTFGTNGFTQFPGGGFIGWDNTSTSPAFNGTMIGPSLGDDFNIQTAGGLWKFGNDGSLTFPQYADGNQPTAVQYFGMGNLFAETDGNYTVIGTANPATGASNYAGIGIMPGIESQSGVYIPNDTLAGSAALWIANNNSDGRVQIEANSHSWYFNADGTTQFPHYTFPAADGTNNQILKTDGSGNLTWVDASAASTGDIRFTGHKIHEASLGTVSIQTTADPSHWWSEYGELLYNTADSWGSSIEYDSEGNMYVIGGTYHDDGTGNSTNIKSILIKYSSAGAVVWAKTITDPDDQYLRGEGIWVDGNDYIYLILTNDDTNWSYILKVNGSGTIIWQKKIDAATDGNLRFTDIDGGNGHIYVSGSYNYVAADERTEFFVGSFSTTDGSCVWQQTIADIVVPGYHNIYTYGIAYGGDANQVYITGYVYNSEINDQDDGLLISMSATDGSITWSKQISFPGYDWYVGGNDVAVDPNSGYVYTVGEHSSGLSLIKFDPSGNIIWQKIINKYGQTYGNSLDFDSSGNVYVTGTTRDSANTNFRRAWVIVKFDTSGNILWQRSFGSGLANTYQWYYDGHKEIALHGDVFAVTGYTYAGPHAGSLNNSSILTAQLPIDGSKTGSYDSFSYEPTDFTAADDTLSTNAVTYTATVSTYTITTPSLAFANAGEDSNLYPFSGDTWNFNPGAILELPGGGDILDSNTGNSVINVLRSGVHTATMNPVGVIVDETGRSLTGESNGRIASGSYWNNIPLQIRHATGYKHLESISTPQDWLDLADVATQVGVANSNWITGMIIEFQAFASGNIVGVSWQNSYMTGQIIIANSGDGRMSLTHSEAAISNYDGSANDLVWSGMDLWIKDLSQGQKIAVARTDGHTLEQLDIQWTARVFTNPAEYFC